MALVCTVLQTAHAWEALIPEWLALWQQSSSAKPFQHPDWLLPWWRAFTRHPLRVAVARKEGGLLAMLPFFLYRDPATNARKLLLAGAGTSDYLDGVFAAECPEDNLLALLAGLKHESWDRADLTQISPESPLYGTLSRLTANGVLAAPGDPCSRRPASTVADLPPKLRAEVRYQTNAAGTLGKLGLRRATTEDWEPMFDQLVLFHTERWERAGESGVLADPCVLAHHREALPALLAGDLAQLTTLYAGEHSLGVLYSLLDPPSRSRRTQYLYLMGYAPRFERFKPGVLLLALAMEQAAREGFHTIDMLRGTESYKKFWRVEAVPTYSFSFVPTLTESLF